MENKKEKQNILFLDIDGVLMNENTMYYRNDGSALIYNDGYYFLRESLEVLRHIVDKYNFKIVLSSSWRHYWNSTKIENRKVLETVLGNYGLEIMDITPDYLRKDFLDSLDNHNRRGLEIYQWICDNKDIVNNILILDDDDDMGELKGRLVKTTWKNGLLDKHINEVDKCMSI